MVSKRVLLFTENLGSGGAERQLTELAVLLKEKGYIVKIATYYRNQFFEPFLNRNNIDYVFLDGAFDKKKRLFIINRLLKEYHPNTVVSYLPVPNMTMCLLQAVHKFRLIVSERSHTTNWGIEALIRFNLYRFATYIVCNSFSENENILTHYPPLKNKLITIPNFIDTHNFKPTKSSLSSSVKILSVGRITSTKNVLRTLEAVIQLKGQGYSFVLTWVGSLFDKDYVAKVEEYITANCLTDYVHIIDQQNDLLPYYQDATFFFFPSYLEGYPNALCEAMSSGLPIVCSNVCEMPKIVIENENGFLFNPFDIDDMVRALERMLNLDKVIFAKMKETNRKKIITNNSLESFVNQYIKII